MRNILLLSISFMMLIFNSCIYNSDEFVFKELEQPSDMPSVTFLNVPMNGDTMFIDTFDEIDIIIDAGEYKVVKNTVYVNDNAYTSNGFVINTDRWPYSAEPYEIEVELTISSNSHSIADQLGREGFSGKQRFIVMCIKDLSHEILQEESVDGTFKLIWPKIKSKRVKKYIIEKSRLGEKHILHTFETKENWIVDEYYVGESIEYEIYLIDNEGVKYKLWRHRKSANNNITIKSQNDGTYLAKWPKCLYSNNLKELSLYKSGEYGKKLLFTTSDFSITSFDLPLSAKFGSDGYYSVVGTLKNKPSYYETDKVNYAWRGGYVGDFFEQYNVRFIGQVNENNVLILKNGHVFKYSNAKKKVIDSLDHIYFREYGFDLSSDGKFLCYLNQDHNKISIWKTAKFSIPPIIEREFSYIYDILISSSGKCLLTESHSVFKLYDIYKNTELLRISESSIIGAKISSNGNYLFLDYPDNTLCYYESNKLTNIIEFPDSYFLYESFDPTNQELFFYHDRYSRMFTKYDIVNNKIVIQSAFDFDVKYIDYYSRKGLGYDYNKLIVFNIDTHQIIKEIPASSSLNGYASKLFLINNTIYSTLGIKYEIQ